MDPQHEPHGEHVTPPDVLELYEVMEWENGVAAAAGRPLPHPDIPVPPVDPEVDR